MPADEPELREQLLDRLQELSRLAYQLEQQRASVEREAALDLVARERVTILSQLSLRRTRPR